MNNFLSWATKLSNNSKKSHHERIRRLFRLTNHGEGLKMNWENKGKCFNFDCKFNNDCKCTEALQGDGCTNFEDNPYMAILKYISNTELSGVFIVYCKDIDEKLKEFPIAVEVAQKEKLFPIKIFLPAAVIKIKKVDLHFLVNEMPIGRDVVGFYYPEGELRLEKCR